MTSIFLQPSVLQHHRRSVHGRRPQVRRHREPNSLQDTLPLPGDVHGADAQVCSRARWQSHHRDVPQRRPAVRVHCDGWYGMFRGNACSKQYAKFPNLW